MLHEFLRNNRDELIERVRAKVAEREAPRATERELDRGIPLFFTNLSALLEPTRTDGEHDAARKVMSSSSVTRGQSLLAEGLTVAQVVHDYGDIGQVVTELAIARHEPISPGEFLELSRCLDDAIAGAVTEYARVREGSIASAGTERLAVLAHELRNALSTAMISFDMIKRGAAGTGGSVGVMHARSLSRLQSLIDGSLAEVRLDAKAVKRAPVIVAEFIEEAEIAAIIEARTRSLQIAVSPVPAGLVVHIDRELLASALSNLLQNAFKFTQPRTLVAVHTRATADRVHIDVQDECGGLPVGKAEELFRPYTQRNPDRSGLGLGLTIARRAVEANGGELTVHDLPSVGCRFTIDLPRSV